MHIISKKRLLEAAKKHSNAKTKIAFWYTVAKKAVWNTLAETRKSFPHADQVAVKSGRTVTIFNVSNAYRLITAMHYDRKKVFILRFLTHPDYSKNEWKDTL